MAPIVIALQATALPEDATEELHLQADSVEGTMTERTIATGAVRMDQGTLRVEAETMAIDWAQGDIVRITAHGDRAHLQQRLRPNEPLVKADADVIVYHRDDERIELQGNAYLNQLDNEFRGEKILYDIRTGVVDADSGEQTDRVEIIWKPKAQSN